MIREITERRSIRRFKETQVPRTMLEEIIKAGMLAPSSKNRQPWKFIVTAGREKANALQAMETGLLREKEAPLLPGSAMHLCGAEQTLKIMRQAPVVIFIVNPLALPLDRPLNAEDHISEICNAQSAGAAIENMSLAAVNLGLGSLWICDTYFAHEELLAWLGETGGLFAAFAVGYADEAPAARPRKALEETVVWRI